MTEPAPNEELTRLRLSHDMLLKFIESNGHIHDYRKWLNMEGCADSANETSLMQRLMAALIAGFSKSWVANAGITGDIEALRRICVEHADWWNNTAWPALEAAGVKEADLFGATT